MNMLVPVYCGEWNADEGNLQPYNVSWEHARGQLAAAQYITENSYGTLPSPTTHVPMNPGYHSQTSYVADCYYDPRFPVQNPYITRGCDERCQLPLLPLDPQAPVRNFASQGAGYIFVDEGRGSSRTIKAEGPSSPTRVRAPRARAIPRVVPAVESKEITRISPVLGDRSPQSDNPVDALLAVIQSKPDLTCLATKLDGLSVAEKQEVGGQQPQLVLSSRRCPLPTLTTAATRKRYRAAKHLFCDFEGCSRGFAHKAQLESHIRAHTGEKPYECGYPGCHESFSQKGNRTTHRRGHTGEAPFGCPMCGKRFRSGGNVPPHVLTHYKVKAWPCKLDGCDKACSNKGNLKTHQANYHRAALEALKMKFIQYKDVASAPEEDREMMKYFIMIHNNANKGIKGCRGRRIRRLTMPGYTPPSTPASMVFPHGSNSHHYEPFTGYLQPYQLQQQQFPATNYDFSRVPAYRVTPVCDSDDSTSAASPTSTATWDDEQDNRTALGHRWY